MFLAQIDGQLFGVDKACVRGVGGRDDARLRPVERGGVKYLPLAGGQDAVVCDLRELMAITPTRPRQDRQGYYLVADVHGRALVLVMTGKGRLVSIDETGCVPLPPAFTGVSRQVTPKALVNGGDVLLLLDLSVLMHLVERVGDAEGQDEPLAAMMNAGAEKSGEPYGQ